jgi:glycosyltransferase involved in cell wall biosynthesis
MVPDARPTVVALVHNDLTHDSRVRNEAASLAAAGWRVIVAAVADRSLPDRESVDGYEVARFGYDPEDMRIWRRRTLVSKPWRHRRSLARWVRVRLAGDRRSVIAAVLAVVGVIILVPWVALTLAYHFGIRAIDRLVRRPPGRRPSRVVGRWIEERAWRSILVAHRPLRLRDWGLRIGHDIGAGALPRADVWHAHDLETLPIALRLAENFGGRVVYDSHEIFLEAASRARMGRTRRRLLRHLEGRWARRAAAVVTVNDAVAAELVRRYAIPPPLVVRNCPPAWTQRDDARSPLLGALTQVVDDPSLPIVIAHGTFHVHRGYEQLLAAAEGIAGVNVVFLGYGARTEEFQALAAAPPWRGRLAVLPAVPPHEVVEWVAGASIAACLIQPSTLNHRLSTPNKLFEAIAAGVPVLAADLPAIAAIVRESGAGILVDPTDARAVRDGLVRLLGDDALRNSLAAAARDAARRELNWEHEVDGLIRLYERLAPVRARAA